MSSKAVAVSDLGKYIGRWVEGTFTDGWDDWPVYGKLVSLDPSDGRIYIEVCSDKDCEDCVPDTHGAFAFRPTDTMRVRISGGSGIR